MIMRIFKYLPGLAGVLLLLPGTQVQAFDFFDREPEAKVTAGHDSPSIDQIQAEAYNGPKARVAVARFTNKTNKHWWSREIGDGMADQLTTALFNSNRFIVLERQTINDVLREQDLGASGRISQPTAAPVGQIEGAELLITGAVTEFEGNASGTRGAAAGWLGNVVGAIAGGVQSSHMAIDVRVIDARTSRIVAATSVEGKSSDVNLGGAVGTYFGGGAVGGALSSWKNTPKEKALRVCINKAVDFIVGKTPKRYYHLGSGTRMAAAPSSRRRTASAGSKRSVPRYASGSVVRVSSSRLNVRGGPSTSNPVVFSARGNDPLLVEDQKGNWLQVKNRQGTTGWVAGWLVTHDPALNAVSFTMPQPSARTMTTATPAAAAAATATATVPAKDSPMERLKKLKTLYEQGLITEQEYDAKRQKILEAF